MKFNVGDLFLAPGNRGILIEINDFVEGVSGKTFTIYWSLTRGDLYEVKYGWLEINEKINKGHWKHIPVKR